jgi:hypothetical protein
MLRLVMTQNTVRFKMTKQNFRQGETSQDALGSLPHSVRTALSFSLVREGDMNKECLECEDYLKRGRNMMALGGIWDFDVCNRTCWQKEDPKNKYQRIWQKAHYTRLAGVR